MRIQEPNHRPSRRFESPHTNSAGMLHSKRRVPVFFQTNCIDPITKDSVNEIDYALSNVFLKHKQIISILPFGILASCSNPETPTLAQPHPYRILFLGNSITFHGANSSLGWNGDWGMAASVEDSDYVHQLIRKIRSNNPTDSVFYRAKNIAAWEGDFSVDPHALIDTAGFHPNIVIIRLGENVPDTTTPTRYFNELNKLIGSFQSDTIKVLVTGNFWASAWKDSVQHQAALKMGCPFADFAAISSDSSHNQATGLFSNGAVARHPSDQGMRAMSDSIYSQLVSNSILR